LPIAGALVFFIALFLIESVSARVGGFFFSDLTVVSCDLLAFAFASF
jgi:hypothetical protein